MFATGSMLTSVAHRKLEITGVKDADYIIDGAHGFIKLVLADKDSLKKGSWATVELVTKIKTFDRTLFVVPHEDLIRNGVVTGTSMLGYGDSGSIVLQIKPNRDIDLTALPYICRVFVER